MKIVYLIPNNNISGGVVIVLQHIRNLEKMGHEAILVTQDNSDCLPWNRGVKVTPLNKFKLNGNYDLVFATLWATVPLLEKIRSKRKLYLIQMDERNFYDKATDIKKVEETYKIKEIEFVTMARWIQDWLLDEFGRDSFYIPNGIDLSLFKPVEPRLSRVRRFLIEGKINVPAKGVAEAYKVIEKMPCERWIVSGDGEKPRDWNINKFFLRVNQRRMVQIYQKCDVLLKMSRVESFELPPLEMMACGGTAIIRKVNGIEDYAIDGYNCLIVNDFKEAQVAATKLINDRKLLNHLRKNALRTAQKWSYENQRKYLEALLNPHSISKKELIKEYQYSSHSSSTMFSDNGNSENTGLVLTKQRANTCYKYIQEDSINNYSKYDLLQSLENHKSYINELETIISSHSDQVNKLTVELDVLNKMVFWARKSRVTRLRNKVVKYFGRGPI